MTNVLETEERNLLSTAYKNVIAFRRSTWRIITVLEEKHEDNAKNKQLASNYIESIEKEVHEISNEIL